VIGPDALHYGGTKGPGGIHAGTAQFDL